MANSIDSSFVAAIVIGSSKITGTVGSKEPDGTLKVYAYKAIPSSDFINKGRVVNVNKLISTIRSIRDSLEEQMNRRIKHTHTAVECMGIRSAESKVEKSFLQRETVTQDHISQVLEQNREQQPSGILTLDTIHLEYRLGTIATTEPIGVMTDNIKAQLLNIICKAETIQNIELSFRKAEFTIARLDIASMQLANIFTSEQERTSGCVFVNMGSETTSVAVYKGKLLRHFATIPLGSANITKDIAKIFNCEESEAEILKLDFGYPNFEDINEEGGQSIPLRDGGRIRKEIELAEIIEARTEEIIQNIKHQVDLSGFHRENLVNGLFVTGGGAQLHNISSAFNQHFKDWNIHILRTPPRITISGEHKDFNIDGTYNVGLAIIENGKINCDGGILQNTPEEDLFTAPTEQQEVDEPIATEPVEISTSEADLEKSKAKNRVKPQKPNKFLKTWHQICRIFSPEDDEQ